MYLYTAFGFMTEEGVLGSKLIWLRPLYQSGGESIFNEVLSYTAGYKDLSSDQVTMELVMVLEIVTITSLVKILSFYSYAYDILMNGSIASGLKMLLIEMSGVVTIHSSFGELLSFRDLLASSLTQG